MGRIRDGGGRRAGRRRRGGGGRVVLAQRQRGLLPDGLLRARRPRRQRRCSGRRRRVPRQRRGRQRLGAQEAAPLQGAGRVPGGELQGAQHPEPEAEGGAGEAAQPPAAPGGGVVPEPPSQDEAEADGGGLRVPEAVLRDADGGEPAAAEGAGGAAGAQDGAPLLHEPPGHHPLHVPLLRARRLQLRPGLRHGPRGRAGVRAHRRRHWARRRAGGAQAVVVRRAVLVCAQLPDGRPAAGARASTVELVISPGPAKDLSVNTLTIFQSFCPLPWIFCGLPLPRGKGFVRNENPQLVPRLSSDCTRGRPGCMLKPEMFQ